ncbi:thymidylate synthase [Streptomyces sp. 4N509B]|uniref:thymidylate synthase n=1 Tax=Streptomyces sp. 4N509B TaxID=3457413 RepID=UPI003FD313B2
MITFQGDSVAALFTQAARTAADMGQRTSPRGLPTRELLDVHLTLTRPRARLLHLPPTRILNPAFAVAEAVWHLLGSDAPWIFDYNGTLRRYADDGVLRGAYGPRMRRWGGELDQLAQVLATLRRDPQSRRAVIQLYDPSRDAAGHRDVPCTLGFRFHLRGGQLHMATTMRSQDVWLGFPYDVFFATVLHELLAGWLGAELGVYGHHVDSLHLYESDLAAASELTPVHSGAAFPVAEMPPLTTDWRSFDELLSQVRDGRAPEHPGWATMAATMRSYRCWKAGDADQAELLAGAIADPLRAALLDWYTHLRARRAARAERTGGHR